MSAENTKTELAFLADLMLTEAGHLASPEMESSAPQKLGALARREGLGNSMELLRIARTVGDPELRSAILEAMCPQDTRFFRDRALWKLLRKDFLPTLARASVAGARVGRPLRIWSAGCGSGQEVYSFAIALSDAAGNSSAGAAEIVGTDLCTRALERAKAGLYNHYEVQRGLPIQALLAHFALVEDSWLIGEGARRGVRWVRHNLLTDMAPLGTFDVISCQNVFTAIAPSHRDNILLRMMQQLRPGGLLIVSPEVSELVRKVGDDYIGVLAPWVFARPTTQRQAA